MKTVILFLFIVLCRDTICQSQGLLFTTGYQPENEKALEDAMPLGATIIFNISHFDRVDYSKYLPFVGDQGIQSTCTAFSVCAALTILENKSHHRTFQKKIEDKTACFSPAYLFGEANILDKSQSCSAIPFLLAIQAAQLSGLMYWIDCQYNPSGNDCFSALNAIKPNRKLKRQFIFLPVSKSSNAFKTVLNPPYETPICIAVKVDNNYCDVIRNVTKVWKHKSSSSCPFIHDPNHAMLIVGYDEYLKAFKVLDSRGPNSGEEGFIWMSYELIDAADSPVSDAFYCTYYSR